MQITPPPPLFCRWNFFLHANARHSKPKVASRCRHAANIAFDLFNIFLYVIARKVRKCPLSPFVTSYIVLSCLVRMADILARLVQKADSLSALTHLPPPTPPPHHHHLLDRSATPGIVYPHCSTVTTVSRVSVDKFLVSLVSNDHISYRDDCILSLLNTT